MKNIVSRLWIFPVGFTILLLAFRILYSGSLAYAFFAWNLFLAFIPLILSSALLKSERDYRQLGLFITWILFFPNALYIITDLTHLKERAGIPLWFDIIVAFSAALNGLLIGFTSLYQIEIFLRSRLNAKKTKTILYICLLISCYGVYIGRFLRWNSWDVFFSPFRFIDDVAQPFISPLQHPRTWAMTIILFLFFGVFYFIIKKLPGLFMKQGNEV